MSPETDLSRIDLNLLVLFEAVMHERHVGRAAHRLHLSPSAISHGLARLRRLLHDPLFLKHPKGVVPTQRAEALASPIAEVLARVRSIVTSADAFDPSTSRRRFTIGAPDAVFGVVMPRIIAALEKRGPAIDLDLRTVLPQTALAELDARHVDLALEPLDDVPPRFEATRLYDEDFVVAMRSGHPLAKRLSLARYAAASHVLVSMSGDPHGNVDTALAKLGRTRRVAATVPNFLLALALVAESDLIAAVPRGAAVYAARFGAVFVEPPSELAPLTASAISVIATRAAMTDAGVAWLARLVIDCVPQPRRRKRPSFRSSHS